MNNFQKEFVMEFFMDNDSISTINRISVAVADVISENNDNLCSYNEIVRQEFGDEPEIDTTDVRALTPVRYSDYYVKEVQQFNNDDYEATFGMRKSTVQVNITNIF